MQVRKKKSEEKKFKEAIEEILPKEQPEEKKPRIKTPTLMQALFLPFYPVPKRDGVTPTWNNQPHLQQLKNEIFICSIAMCTLPFIAFYLVKTQTWIEEEYGEKKLNALAAVAAVFTVQMIIMVTVVVKHWEDFILVVTGKGHIPYEEQFKEDAEYYQSDQYQIDIQKDELRKTKRRRIIEEAKKKTEEQERPLFVGYYPDGKIDLETMNLDQRIKVMEESKRREGPTFRKSKGSKSASSGNQGTDKPAEEVVLQKKGRKKKRKNFKQY